MTTLVLVKLTSVVCLHHLSKQDSYNNLSLTATHPQYDRSNFYALLQEAALEIWALLKDKPAMYL
jgi:hypothetical protein